MQMRSTLVYQQSEPALEDNPIRNLSTVPSDFSIQTIKKKTTAHNIPLLMLRIFVADDIKPPALALDALTSVAELFHRAADFHAPHLGLEMGLCRALY